MRRYGAVSGGVFQRFLYIIREREDEAGFEFVADADAIDPYAKVDTNKDGLIDEADDLGLPGKTYDVSKIDALERGTPAAPIANKKT